MTHDFHESLAQSETVSMEPWWEEIYRTEFSYFESMERIVGDCPEQRAGIDRVIHLRGDAKIYVDEKVRHTDYDDILLETSSSLEHHTLGWACKSLHSHYIVYAFLPSRRCYFLPFHLLQRALAQNWDQWNRDFKKVDAKNHGYTTRNLAVPIDVLQKAMLDATFVRWNEIPKEGMSMKSSAPIAGPTLTAMELQVPDNHVDHHAKVS